MSDKNHVPQEKTAVKDVASDDQTVLSILFTLSLMISLTRHAFIRKFSVDFIITAHIKRKGYDDDDWLIN